MDHKENKDLAENVQAKIAFGENLIARLSMFSNLQGTQKLQKKIKQELRFLKKVWKQNKIKQDHLQCSNLKHYNAIVCTLETTEGCTRVNKVFDLEDRKITVDIVCDNGSTWIKVVARNPKSLSQICIGDASYGVRSILDQAQEFIECAKFYPCLFQTPKIIFLFTYGISCELARELEALGIMVEGNRIENLDVCLKSESYYGSELSTRNASHIAKVNLDVSAMLAYVSSVTNGSCKKYKYPTSVLNQQAEWESQRPVKPILDAFFKDKKLYCCQTAYDSFISILNTVGGPNEKKRSEEFLAKITILPDDASAVDTIETSADTTVFDSVQFTSNKTLPVRGKIKMRSLVIFTFGDRIQAVTVSANDGFVRAAKQQGINFVVFVHESRALTEQKESKATQIE